MAERRMPRYPIYIPSKNRADHALTANFLVEDEVPFRLVIEQEEYDDYASRFGEDRILVLPFSNAGSVIPARNWIKDHSIEEGHARHWQLDDNITWVARWYRQKRIRCRAGIALAITEDFVERYTNVALAGLEYVMFAISSQPPITVNTRIYSCTLVLNSLPHRWRGKYNEDADLCLQVLADNWCTLLMNAFLINKKQSMKIPGGNTKTLYQGDGRLKMARALERKWPGVVSTKRRFNRPQHVVKDSWRRFDTPLIRRDDIDWDNLPDVDDMGLHLEMMGDTIKNPIMQQLYDDSKREAND